VRSAEFFRGDDGNHERQRGVQRSEQTTRVDLDFYGRVATTGEAKLLLLYPSR